MGRLTFLPPIRPDELLYSVIARWSKFIGATSNGAAGQHFFGTRMAVATADLPKGLLGLTERLPARSNLTAHDFVWHTTLFPYFAAYGDLERAARSLDAMISGKGDIHLTLGAAAFRMRSVRTLRFCPSCNHRDYLECGEIWWSRLFQLPGVLVCPIHEEPLRESLIDLDRAPRHRFISAEPDNCPLTAPPLCRPDARQMDRLALVARASAGLLNRRGLRRLELETFRQAYLQRCSATGLMKSRKKVDLTALHDGLLAYWDPVWALLAQDCSKDLVTDLGWLDAMLRKQRKATHPLMHILLHEFLDKLPDIEVAPVHPFGSGPWECLNPAAPHFGQNAVRDLSICRNKGALVASFSCDCGYRYTRGVDRQGHIGPARFRSAGPLLVNHLRDLSVAGSSLREMARQTHLDPKTLVREMKLAGIATTSTMRRAVDKSSSRSSAPRMPEKKRPLAQAEARPRVDWHSRDAALVVRLPSIAAEILNQGPPIRASFSALEQRLAVRDYVLKRRQKLPRAYLALKDLAESKEEFRIRRFKWWSSQLSNLDLPAQRWKVIRQAGIRGEFVSQVLAASSSV